MSAAGISSERWLGEGALSARRAQALLLAGLMIAFVVFRWLQRREPWNSDDMDLFQLAVDAATGQHWVFGSSALAPGERIPHPAFRVGLLPVAVPAIKALGATATAYYLVPLLFSLLGFYTLYWVTLTHFGPLVALVFAAIHLAWPFELEHASVLLTDLPSAAVSILSLCLLDASARRSYRGRIACAVLAGLLAWETYLLRNNGLVLLAPAYLVFFCFRATRVQTLWASAVILLGVLGQQAFLVYRGFGLGYDWISVRLAFADYAEFLPVYSWWVFLVRQFGLQVSTFGYGLPGYLAALLVLGSLVLHVLLLRFERRALLLSIAAFGLFAWLVFSFSIYELVPGGVRATVPVNFRFIQPFTYSSLVVWAWAWWSLRERLAAGRGFVRAASTARSARLQQLAVVALPLLLIGFSALAAVVRSPETYRQGGTHRLVQALRKQLAQSDEPLLVVGANASLRVPRIFCCAGESPRVEWRSLPVGELAELVERGSPALVLRDVPRELRSARYYPPEERRIYRGELDRLEESLWRDYELAYVDTTYALFGPPSSGKPRAADIFQSEAVVPASAPVGAPRIAGASCRVLPDAARKWRTLVPSREGSRAACEQTWPSDSRIVSALDPGGAPAGGKGFVLRLKTDYDVPLSLSAEVVEQTERDVHRQRVLVHPGTTYVPVPLHAGARSVSVVYRLKTRGAPEGQVARAHLAEWRPHRFGAGEGTRRSEP